MILNPGKVMKHSSENKTEEDFISKLPDELLTQILSLLPDADGCRTTILSKRWKDLWMFLPNLHVVIPYNLPCEHANEYYDLVDKTLAIRDGMPIQRFFLHCDCEAPECDLKRVYDWLRIVVQCGVQILVLKVFCYCNPPRRYILEPCWDFFKTCKTLVELTLEGEFKLDVPKDKVLFPSMKKISLVGIHISDDGSFENLITGCPVLEELCFTREYDSLWRINVSSTSLKRLSIHTCSTFEEVGCEVTIDAPNLEYLYIMDEMEIEYSFTVKPLSLVEAYIDAIYSESFDQIVTNISAAKVLALSFSNMRAFDEVYGVAEFDEVDEINEVDAFDEVNDSNVRMFPNLVKLVINMRDIRNWRLLVVLLHNMPKLEHLTFLNNHPSSYMSWNPPLHAPACLRFRMKEIALLNLESVTEEEFALIKFLLKHSSNLEKFTIKVRENDHERREKLLNFFRTWFQQGNRCQVEFAPSL